MKRWQGRQLCLERGWKRRDEEKRGKPWHELVEAMRDECTAFTEPAEAAVSQAIDRILTTGHTSGADALAGFIMALKTS